MITPSFTTQFDRDMKLAGKRGLDLIKIKAMTHKKLYSTPESSKIIHGGMNMEVIKFTPTSYPSDLTDVQWEIIKEYFPQGPNSEHHKRSLINAVLYLNNNGCKWRALPHVYPPWSTVHSFYFRARKSGLWDKVLGFTVKKTV